MMDLKWLRAGSAKALVVTQVEIDALPQLEAVGF